MMESGAGGKRFTDDAQLERLVRDLESCTVPPAEFKHGAHLAVALWHLAHLPEREAFARTGAGIRRFAAHHGSNLYNETITLFWLKLVGNFLARAADGEPLHETANRLVSSSEARVVFDYYSRELVWSDEAKAGWVEPDLKPLDC